ncbi:large ribosomal subunit protein uL23m-like [Styela clava]|uniref:39S ribosomal protein L23, mitochondrial-like n=1 Tax=Styela clava TaxID=7725 RepID=UPI0019395565|nr:39S ribosomal protein L23, mitochondrial-like [Styela clava]
MSRIRIPGKLPYLQFSPFYKGAPQRRLFFPDWYVKLVKPYVKMPSDYVRFHVPHDMTKYDLKEYLEKIYEIPVASVELRPVQWGRYQDESRKWCFTDPYKIAHVRLGKGMQFEYPDLTPTAEQKDENPDDVTMFERSQKELAKQKPKADPMDIEAKLSKGNSWFQ